MPGDMARPSKLKPEDWEGPIREVYETDTRSNALNLLAEQFGVTARRIRQVGEERGWVRAPIASRVVPEPEPMPGDDLGRETVKNAVKVRRARSRETSRPPSNVKLPRGALADATPEQLAAAGMDTHRNAPPAPEDKKRRKPIKRDAIQTAQQAATRNLDERAPPMARAVAYAAIALDPTKALDTYRMMVEQQVVRTTALSGVFTKMVNLIDTVITPVDPEDQEAMKAQAAAINSLLPGRTDSLAGVVTAARQLAEVLRAHEAGMMDVHVEAARRKAAQELEAQEAKGNAPTREEDIAYEDMTIEQQLQLLAAAELLDANRHAPDFPVPPTGPVLEHAPLAEAPAQEAPA